MSRAGVRIRAAAAQALGCTQSAVSRQISALESATGAQLFDRLPRGVRLTEQGRCLLGHAEAVIRQLSAARRDLGALRDLETGRVRVGAFDSADAALVPRAMATFRAVHPGVSLSLVEGDTAVQLGRVQNGEVDLAVMSTYPRQTPDTARFDLHYLCDDPLMVALATGHRLARRTTLRLTELAGENWIEGWPEGCDALTDACVRAGFRPRIDFAVREWTAKQGFVAAGLGLALVPLLAASAARPDIVLAPLHPDDAPIRTVHAATKLGIAKSPAVTVFLRCLDQTATHLRAG